MAHRARRGDRQVARRTAKRVGRDRSPAAAQPIDGRPAGRPYIDLSTRVLYRDNQCIVIDKPAGLPVHSGPRQKESIESLLDALKFGLSQPPIPAHRLDHDTSGCLVLARNGRARRKLGRLFSSGRIEKVYWAIVEGAPPATEGRIDLPLRKVMRKEDWRMVTDPAGQAAATDYKVLGRHGSLAWLELRPRTGRTHQIRVHCAALGCPILDDPLYGAATGAEPLHLFARSVAIPFYEGRPPIEVVAPPPPHMQAMLQTFV
jgi:tRNA pseudouridine32 synthase/23S rRNA pseudouridine746 synthase/23S rRNA pseudouridine1911/1915/1917 synthase